MQQKAILDLEVEEQTSPAKRIFSKIFFVLAFMFLMIALMWLVAPKVVLLEAQIFDFDGIEYNSGSVPTYSYTEHTDDPVTFANYDEWHAKHDVTMRIQHEPVWIGYAALGLFVLSLVISMLLSYRARAAFKSSTPSRTIGRYALFIVIILIMLDLISTPLLLFAGGDRNESLPIWSPLVFGSIFGFIIGFGWWSQAKLSGRYLNSGYRYDAGFATGGVREHTPSVYWVEAGEYVGETNEFERPHYPVEDLSAWAEEDKKQYQMSILDEASRYWIGYNALN